MFERWHLFVFNEVLLRLLLLLFTYFFWTFFIFVIANSGKLCSYNFFRSFRPLVAKFEVQIGWLIQTIIGGLVFSIIVSKDTLSCFNLYSYPFASTYEIVNRLLGIECFCEINCVLPTLVVVHAFDIFAKSMPWFWVLHKCELFFLIKLSQNVLALNLPVLFPLPVFAKQLLVCLKHLHLAG